MKRALIIILLLFAFNAGFALEISHAEPPNWWNDMEHDTLKILVFGDDFTGWQASTKAKNVKLIHKTVYDDPHYYGLTLKVKKAGDLTINFNHPAKDKTVKLLYSIHERQEHKIMNIDGSDVVYLLMPDRFADGDKGNNDIPWHQDPLRPEHQWGRRGGDIQGVIDHLDYLEELGITALWMTPVYENNYINCYHGYTPTNSYKIDPFLGDFEIYHNLIDECHERGIKVIQDHIVNHIAPTHPLAVNPPSSDWINGTTEEHEGCNYRILDITDSYGPEEQREFPVKGWFAGYLTDMNMANPEVVDYFIHHAIWWIETMKLDGIREDTYAYSDINGLNRWAKELKREYPDLFIVGEIMDFDRTRLSYYFSEGRENYLSSIADFGFSSEIYQLIVENKSINEFHREIANDFIYRDPNMMLTFLDNHDMGRFYSAVISDEQRYLNALTLLFGMRGIPQLYYGDEIGMLGGYDPKNRMKFPGGFGYSMNNAFSKEGRTDEENLIFDQIKAFTTIRKKYPAIFTANMIHDLQHDIYLVSRKDPQSGKTLLLAYNSSLKTQEVSFANIIVDQKKDYFNIKLPLRGKMNIDLENKMIVVPGSETIMMILE
ncbi:MAG: alpha-amylase family glycosyl hydrolase [Candidatus Marinimicrobia bacterium]|nr:alpha-amylase family glycosyl hydrolase [Candidatus Neomarinimicrobiota bacterium]